MLFFSFIHQISSECLSPTWHGCTFWDREVKQKDNFSLWSLHFKDRDTKWINKQVNLMRANISEVPWLTLVIPATWEAGIWSEAKPRQETGDPIWKITKKQKVLGDVAQVVEHCLASAKPWVQTALLPFPIDEWINKSTRKKKPSLLIAVSLLKLMLLSSAYKGCYLLLPLFVIERDKMITKL
jgi:hypothetical protein